MFKKVKIHGIFIITHEEKTKPLALRQNFEVIIKERTTVCPSLLRTAWAVENTDPLPGIKPLN